MNDPATSCPAAVADTAPRRNGELVFEEPWQSRAFGMVVALTEARVCDYEEFRRRLIETIGRWDRDNAATPENVYRYYEHWLESLQRLVTERGLLSEPEIAARAEALDRADSH